MAVDGGFISATELSDLFGDTGWLPLEAIDNDWEQLTEFRRTGKMVTVQLTALRTGANYTGNFTFGFMPEGFRPQATSRDQFVSSTTPSTPGRVTVFTTGEIQCTTITVNTNHNITGQVVYFID